MRVPRSVSALAGLALLIAVVPCRAGEPQVAFVLKDGWVELVLRQDGRPLAEARMQVTDERGRNFAEGETGKEGEAGFPLPRGKSFIVEFKTGERMADPIRLARVDDEIQPARVLLSYGLRPCCRFKSRPDAVVEPTESDVPASPTTVPPTWLWVAALPIGISLVAVLLFLMIRQFHNVSDLSPRR